MIITIFFAVFRSFLTRIPSKILFFMNDNSNFTLSIKNHDKHSVGKTTTLTRWCIGTTQ